ncbi:hypothetical protein FHG87_008801 [Trinorchestia longiramus]|nr:hypothetical protein FHG87_008801 [Trinorchestia longiramus]
MVSKFKETGSTVDKRRFIVGVLRATPSPDCFLSCSQRPSTQNVSSLSPAFTLELPLRPFLMLVFSAENSSIYGKPTLYIRLGSHYPPPVLGQKASLALRLLFSVIEINTTAPRILFWLPYKKLECHTEL